MVVMYVNIVCHAIMFPSKIFKVTIASDDYVDGVLHVCMGIVFFGVSLFTIIRSLWCCPKSGKIVERKGESENAGGTEIGGNKGVQA